MSFLKEVWEYLKDPGGFPFYPALLAGILLPVVGAQYDSSLWGLYVVLTATSCLVASALAYLGAYLADVVVRSDTLFFSFWVLSSLLIGVSIGLFVVTILVMFL